MQSMAKFVNFILQGWLSFLSVFFDTITVRIFSLVLEEIIGIPLCLLSLG